MIIHYNNGAEEKLLRNILYIGVIDGEHSVTVLTKSGKEYNIRIDRIEAILDDEIAEKEQTKMSCKDCLHYEVCALYSKRESFATLYCAEECPRFTNKSEWVHFLIEEENIS